MTSAPLAPPAPAPGASPVASSHDRSLLRRTVPACQAAGVVGGALLASAAAIDVARAWTTTQRGGDAGEVVSGLLVALLLVSAFGLVVRARVLAPFCIVSVYALLAHGSALVISGETVGAIFLGIVPLVVVLARVTVGDSWLSRILSRKVPPTARAAAHAASPNPCTMHA